MRVVVCGTGPFAVPMLQALLDSAHEVVALVTQPPRVGRGGRPAPPAPMRAAAESAQLPIFDPESINTAASLAQLADWQPDLLVVADYGQILRDEVLASARLGGVNLHGSLLPRYRGAAPINWAIYHGETVTGVSVIQMTARLDAGPVIAQASLAIGPDETALELEPRLAELGAPLVCQMVDALAQGDVTPLLQDPALATTARRLRKSDGQVDWSRGADAIRNQVRAFEPWPRTYSSWLRPDHPPTRVILTRVVTLPGPCDQPPGTVVTAGSEALHIATGDGVLSIEQLQPAGKRTMPIADFLHGHSVLPGQRFGPDEA